MTHMSQMTTIRCHCHGQPLSSLWVVQGVVVGPFVCSSHFCHRGRHCYRSSTSSWLSTHNKTKIDIQAPLDISCLVKQDMQLCMRKNTNRYLSHQAMEDHVNRLPEDLKDKRLVPCPFDNFSVVGLCGVPGNLIQRVKEEVINEVIHQHLVCSSSKSMPAWGWLHLLVGSLVRYHLNFSQRNILYYQPSVDIVDHHYYVQSKLDQFGCTIFGIPIHFVVYSYSI